MSLIVDLLSGVPDSKALDTRISENIYDLECYIHQHHRDLYNDIWDVDDSIVLSSQIIDDLDFSKPANTIFLTNLLDYSERFKLQSSFQVLHGIAEHNEISLGSRHHAAYLFLLTIQVREDHLEIFDKIVITLQKAFEEEEDDDVNVLVTFSNYLLNVIRNTAKIDSSIYLNILERIARYRENSSSFLDKPYISEILERRHLAPSDIELQIQRQVEHLLTVDYIQLFTGNNQLMEESTEYAGVIHGLNPSFDSIRQYAFDKFNNLADDEKQNIMISLQRGVKIIEDENSLYAYLTLYGRKHSIKLNDVLGHLSNLPSSVNLLDWACGQALASMLFTEYLDSNHLSCAIKNLLLIEPSRSSLERAALHSSFIGRCEKISTIHKDLDTLNNTDFSLKNGVPYVHLFSNILDVEAFNISHIQTLISDTFNGENWFIITSPYINDKKRNRIQMFVNWFSERYADSFEYLYERDSVGTNPTMVNRIFKVIL
jgi:hypothetical protein